MGGDFGKKRLSLVGWIFLIVILVTVIVGGVTLLAVVNHKIQIGKEKEILAQYDTGGVTEINGAKVNYKIFNPGKTRKTIVVIPGINEQGAALTSGKYAEGEDARVVVINRPGYALSDETEEEVTLDFVVDYYRETLKKLGVSGAVYLLPRASSRMYAEHWRDKYASEVAAVMDDGGALNNGGEEVPRGLLARIYNLGAKLGFSRFFANTEKEVEDLVAAGYEQGLAEAVVAISAANAYPDFVVGEGELLGE